MILSMDENMIQKGIIGLIVVVIIGALAWVLMTPPGGSTEGRQVNIALAEDDLRLGDENAPVTLVNFSDLQCGACAAYDGIINPLLASYDDSEVQYVYRHFPLRAIHANADLAAQALEAAARLGEFEEMKTEIFLNQAQWAQLSTEEAREVFIGYAESLDLDVDEFEELLDSDEVKSKVERDYQSGVAIGVNATPTFVLNGRVIANPSSQDEFRALIDAELGRGEEEALEIDEE